jgi:hypothetical protein
LKGFFEDELSCRASLFEGELSWRASLFGDALSWRASSSLTTSLAGELLLWGWVELKSFVFEDEHS